MSIIVNGILIEGTDYSGKTRLAKNLTNIMQKQGRDAKYRKEYFSANDDEVVRLVNKGLNIGIGEKQDYYFTVATLIDRNNYNPNTSEITIMDRNWLSMVSHYKFFYPNSDYIETALALEKLHFPFKQGLYLTFDEEEKRKRFCQKYPESKFDLFLMKNPHIHSQYDDFFRGLIPDNENWRVIDTSKKTQKETLEEALEIIKPMF